MVKLGFIGGKCFAAFRETFHHASSNVMHYFPGHMAKGLQQMQKTLPIVDCIVEVHDARIPFSGRNPKFKEMLTGVRPHLLVLNKMDIADLSNKAAVTSKLINEHGVSRVIYTTCKQNTNVKQQVLKSVVELIESNNRFNRTDVDHYNVLIIGVPNVGKSSLINALRQTVLHKAGKPTPVGPVAGVTRSVMERIKISEQPKVYVYDTPGIMLPNIKDMDVGMKLALCATLRDHLIGTVTIADYMLFWLNKHSLFHYAKIYDLGEPVDDIFYFLASIAKQHNMVQKLRSPAGGYVFRPNFDQAAQIALTDFRSGRLGKVNLDFDLLNDENANDINVNETRTLR